MASRRLDISSLLSSATPESAPSMEPSADEDTIMEEPPSKKARLQSSEPMESHEAQREASPGERFYTRSHQSPSKPVSPPEREPEQGRDPAHSPALAEQSTATAVQSDTPRSSQRPWEPMMTRMIVPVEVTPIVIRPAQPPPPQPSSAPVVAEPTPTSASTSDRAWKNVILGGQDSPTSAPPPASTPAPTPVVAAPVASTKPVGDIAMRSTPVPASLEKVRSSAGTPVTRPSSRQAKIEEIEIKVEDVPSARASEAPPSVDAGPSVDDELMMELDAIDATGEREKRSTPVAKPKPKKATAKSAKSKGKITKQTGTSKSKGKSDALLKAVHQGNAASRSRSTSQFPASSPPPTAAEPEDADTKGDEAEEDDRLYCICKTTYDEEKVMICCDRCDEWYHVQCIDIPETEVELVDQFACPLCREKNPSWTTTYKQRCFRGLAHPRPNSPSACHMPARRPISKYCSDECGIQYVDEKISAWRGDEDDLWHLVRGANRREGMVVAAPSTQPTNGNTVQSPPIVRDETEERRLRDMLDVVMKQRAEAIRQLEFIVARERLVNIAIQRSEMRERQSYCGWDCRLIYEEDEWEQWVLAGGLEALEAEREGDDIAEGGGGRMWCDGRRKCERHAGWQKLYAAESDLDRAIKDLAIQKLTTKERELRRRIEDLEHPTISNGHAQNGI